MVQDFARSELFQRTFHDGMELVEETAAYLDGAGRQDSKQLPREAALAYASVSMRLTTRLMQIASWLLVQRAVREGDMAAAEACQDRYRLNGGAERPDVEPARLAELPSTLVDLLGRSERLFERVGFLDRRMYREEPGPSAGHPVLAQLERLHAVFSRDAAAE